MLGDTIQLPDIAKSIGFQQRGPAGHERVQRSSAAVGDIRSRRSVSINEANAQTADKALRSHRC